MPQACKDCTRPAQGARCAGCKGLHNAREARRRAEHRKAGMCSVCSQRAVIVNGITLSLCKVHRAYYVGRSQNARAESKSQ